MKLISKYSLLILIAVVAVFSSCDKTKPYDLTVPPSQAHFVGAKLQVYPTFATPLPPYDVVIGTTDVQNTDRIVSYKVTSPSGAQEGVHYSLPSAGSVTIPANSALGKIPVQAIIAAYTGNRRDTLMITLDEPSVPRAGFLDTVLLVIAPPCNEGNVTMSNFLGTYAGTTELLGTSPYGPYTTDISNATLLTPTTGSITVENIFDAGWGPINFILDWTNPLNRTVLVVPQASIPGSDAGDLNPTYAGYTIAVRNFSGQPGTFSVCDGTLVLKMQLGVSNPATGAVLGYFNVLYTVTPAH